jgi:hypothetical protein
MAHNVFCPGFQGSEQEVATRLGMSRTPVPLWLELAGKARTCGTGSAAACPIAGFDDSPCRIGVIP